MNSIFELLESTAQRLPDKAFIEHGPTVASYADIRSQAESLANQMAEYGVRRGDRVVVFLDQSVAQISVMFAASRLGAVFVFANPDLARSQVEHIVHDSGATLFVSDQKKLAAAKLSLDIAVMEVEAGVDSSSTPADATARTRQDIACLIYTSGSTGKPKGVVVPSATLLDGARIVSGYLELTESDRILTVLPINFDYGLNQILGALHVGATVVLHKLLFVKAFLDEISNRKITGLPGMPPVWNKIFNSSFKLPTDLNFSSVRYLSNTGGKVPDFVVEQMAATFPQAQIFLMYGLTEAFRSSYLAPADLAKRQGSIGKAIPEVELMVVDENGNECAPGVAGELVHRGALITLGYWNDQEKTDRVFRKNPRLVAEQAHLNETVVYSGDLVKQDEDGFLYFVSRSDDMIKSSGYRISPTELEEVLCAMPVVSNAVVFGRDLGNGEQAIVAVLESDADADSLDKAALNKHCRDLLPNYMVPREIHIESDFPRTPNGKLDRPKIRKRYA